jgi:hypothetical protein
MRTPFLLCALFLAACSSDGAAPSQDAAASGGAGGAGGASGASGAAGAAPQAATIGLYGPAASTKLTPFPSNRYTRSDAASATGRLLAITPETTSDPLFAAYPTIVQQLNEQDGFSVAGGVVAHFSGPIDRASVERTIDEFHGAKAPFLLLDIDPASPEKGASRGLVTRYFDSPSDDGPGDNAVMAQPATPLRPRTTYLFVATDAIRDADGAAVGPSAATSALLVGQQTGEYEDSVRAALPLLAEKEGVTAEHVVLASVFTTGSVHDGTFAMAKALRASEPPSLVGELVQTQKGSGTDHRIAFKGSLTAPEWRRPAPDGRWDMSSGSPALQGTVNLEFLLAFSDRDQVGPRPVVVFGHGLGDDKSSTYAAARWLAGVGVAVIGIDAPEHGSRATGDFGGDMVKTALAFFSIDLKERAFNLERGCDNLRQMSSDQLQVVRALKGALSTLDVLPAGAPDGVPDLDTSRVLYLGQSFGAILGSTPVALAPEFQGAVLNVGGDGLTTIMFESPLFKLLLDGLFAPGTPTGDKARLLAAAQGLVDPGDPLNYARYVTLEAAPVADGWKPRSVLLQQVKNDQLVPAASTARLARALGLTHVGKVLTPVDGLPTGQAPFSGNLGEGATGALFQFDNADGVPVSHGALVGSTEGSAQHNAFLSTLLATGTAQVIDPYTMP